MLNIYECIFTVHLKQKMNIIRKLKNQAGVQEEWYQLAIWIISKDPKCPEPGLVLDAALCLLSPFWGLCLQNVSLIIVKECISKQYSYTFTSGKTICGPIGHGATPPKFDNLAHY